MSRGNMQVIRKLQSEAAESTRAEVELKRALRDALQQLQTAMQHGSDSDLRAEQSTAAFHKALHAVEDRARAGDAEHAALLARCRELESRDADRLQQIADQGSEITELRGHLGKCRREVKHLQSEAAVSLTQQQYFESSIKAYAPG